VLCRLFFTASRDWLPRRIDDCSLDGGGIASAAGAGQDENRKAQAFMTGGDGSRSGQVASG
jgi:hypothetical protein